MLPSALDVTFCAFGSLQHICLLCARALPLCSADNTLYTSAATFEELGLSPELLQGLYSEMKFERPSKVQVGRAGRAGCNSRQLLLALAWGRRVRLRSGALLHLVVL